MQFLQMTIAAATAFLGQVPTSSLPEKNEPAPYARMADSVLPDTTLTIGQTYQGEQATANDSALAAHRQWSAEVWGVAGAKGYYVGERTAPNGFPYQPIFSLANSFNLGILPNQKLYLFVDTVFWAQKADADAGITNPRQGCWDFSKREFDLNIGFAWNYYGPWELRAFGYASNNLNRGVSPVQPKGYNDGVGLENRFYLPAADKYDVAKRGFLSIGYYPSKTMITGDGQPFSPGLFARAYLTWDLPSTNVYVYLDNQYISEQVVQSRLLTFDGGLGYRPFANFQNLEFRLGVSETYDVQAHSNQTLGYGGFQILY